jgi:hypothetical protein
MPSFVAGDTEADISQHRENRGQGKTAAQQNTPASKQKPKQKRAGREALLQKKEQGAKPCSKNCVDPISPKIGFDLD